MADSPRKKRTVSTEPEPLEIAPLEPDQKEIELSEVALPETEPEPPPLEPYVPPSTQESVRRSGLAWSAGIVFFSSIAFMLLLGWGADLLFGSSPWGLVGGIVVGSIMGFVQFFRISSRIYNPENSEHKMHPLLSREDDDVE